MKKRVLLTSRGFSHKGGVVNYVKTLYNSEHIKDVEFKHFAQSRRSGSSPNLFLDIIVPLFNLLKFVIVLKKFDPHLVHLNPSIQRNSLIRDFVYSIISKVLGYKTIFFIHGWDWKMFRNIKKYIFFRVPFVEALKKQNIIMVLSKDFKEALNELGIKDDKILITNNMVNTNRYYKGDKSFYEPINVLFCSRMVKEKGIFELLESIPLVLKKHPQTKFIFMGDGEFLNVLKEKAKKKGIKSSLLFTGYLVGEKKIEFFYKSHIFVLPSYSEGFPTVVLEAMAACMPVVTTPVGALKYIIKNGKNGYLLNNVPPEKVEIASKINKLINNPQLMYKIGKNNMESTIKKYDEKIVSKKVSKIYENTIN